MDLLSPVRFPIIRNEEHYDICNDCAGQPRKQEDTCTLDHCVALLRYTVPFCFHLCKQSLKLLLATRFKHFLTHVECTFRLCKLIKTENEHDVAQNEVSCAEEHLVNNEYGPRFQVKKKRYCACKATGQTVDSDHPYFIHLQVETVPAITHKLSITQSCLAVPINLAGSAVERRERVNAPDQE